MKSSYEFVFSKHKLFESDTNFGEHTSVVTYVTPEFEKSNSCFIIVAIYCCFFFQVILKIK